MYVNIVGCYDNIQKNFIEPSVVMDLGQWDSLRANAFYTISKL
jgi:hypothetical protein